MDDRRLLEFLLSSARAGKAIARVVELSGPSPGRWALVQADRSPGWERLEAPDALLVELRRTLAARRHATVTWEDRVYWVEVLGRPPSLIIVGAGHLAQPLATLGTMCDFHVTVLDDRPRFADPARFPSADQVIAAPFSEALAGLDLDTDSYLVLVTRGHQHDVGALVSLIDRPHAYIGMVGSRRRVAAVWTLLQQERTLTAEQLDGVYAPIGLDIGGESPAEIAVAIMAEIILVRRGGSGRPLRDAMRARGARVHTARIRRNRQKRS